MRPRSLRQSRRLRCRPASRRRLAPWRIAGRASGRKRGLARSTKRAGNLGPKENPPEGGSVCTCGSPFIVKFCLNLQKTGLEDYTVKGLKPDVKLLQNRTSSLVLFPI